MAKGEEKEEKKVGIKFAPELLELLRKFGEIEFEDVDIEVGDLEVWLQPGAAVAAPPVPPKLVTLELLALENVF